jgi:hypothetical protein
MPDLGLIEGCDFYFVDAVDAEEGMCNETTSTCGRPFPLAAMSSDQSGRFQPSQSHTARPMTSWRLRPLSQGISAPSHRAARAAALGRLRSNSPLKANGSDG